MNTRWRCKPCKTWFSDFQAKQHAAATGHRLSVSALTDPPEASQPLRPGIRRHRPLPADAHMFAFLKGLGK